MYLRQLDIAGFRGIQRLSIMLRPNMVLIGENAWGKSSLLAALSLILNPRKTLYRFTADDFYILSEQNGSGKHITLLFTFSESNPTEQQTALTQPYHSLFVPHEDDFARIYLRVTGDQEGEEVITTYSFLDENGEPIDSINTEELAYQLILHHPAYRFRDARLNHNKADLRPMQIKEEDEALAKEFQAVAQLIQYYFISHKWESNLMLDTTVLWEQAKSLCLKLQQDDSGQLQKSLARAISSLFIGGENIPVDKFTRPILLFEDLEAHLHPRMVSIVWTLSDYLPIQRITTTNSVEVVAEADLRSICRLVRYTDKTSAFQLTRRALGKEDLRRLSFHIHHNRSLALFSRMWILVEGESEVWVLSELAKILGINLTLEGIRIVEFAQSGLRPLIKYAKAMGIEWYVLTDGDDAGRKYSDTVKLMLEEDEIASNRLTTLPKMDIEHFFYSEGFEQVFIRLAQWQPQNNYYPMRKIIQRAIQRTSKPDLAIAISAEIERRGSQSIPLLFRRLFSKVMNLTRTQY